MCLINLHHKHRFLNELLTNNWHLENAMHTRTQTKSILTVSLTNPEIVHNLFQSDKSDFSFSHAYRNKRQQQTA